MTRWLLLIALPGGSLVAAVLVARWLLRRHQARLAALDAARIKPFTYGEGMERHDDSLRIQSVRRRQHADDIRRDALRIETGGESEARRKLHIV